MGTIAKVSTIYSHDQQISYEETAIVVPMFCEAEVIAQVISELRAFFPLIICVDDGSTDESFTRAQNAGAIVVKHPINLGQGAALQTGIEAALLIPRVKVIVTFDADGQHLPEDAVHMVNLIQNSDFDVVFGSRFLDERTQVSFLKKSVLKIAVMYTNVLCGMHLTDAHNGLRAFNRKVAESINLRHSGMAHATEIVNQIGSRGFRFIEAPVHIRYTDYSRAKGQSLWNSVNILFDLIIR